MILWGPVTDSREITELEPTSKRSFLNWIHRYWFRTPRSKPPFNMGYTTWLHGWQPNINSAVSAGERRWGGKRGWIRWRCCPSRSTQIRNWYLQARSSWWFQRFLIFTPIWGKIPNLTNIFQRGWNHQPQICSHHPLVGPPGTYIDLFLLPWPPRRFLKGRNWVWVPKTRFCDIPDFWGFFRCTAWTVIEVVLAWIFFRLFVLMYGCFQK